MADRRARGALRASGSLAALAFALLAGRGIPAGETLEGARRAVRSEEYRPPSPATLDLAVDLFRGLLGTDEIERLARLAGTIGLEVVEVGEGDEDLLVVREPPSARAGRGFFVFRRGAVSSIAFQAPHARDDLLTGPLASKLFRESRAAAAAWSTAPRSARVEGSRSTADLAHLPESLLGSFTRAFAIAHPKGIVVQLHGFDGGARRSSGWPGWQVIVSGGTRSPQAWLTGAEPCLETSLGEPVAVYPRDVRELGGTTNQQGKLLRSLGHAGFLHIEMDLDLRRRLEEAAEMRAAFLRCLSGTSP